MMVQRRIAGKLWVLAVLVVSFATTVLAKDEPAHVLLWPETGQPALRISLGKFRDQGGSRTYMTETTVENLWNKKINLATFSLYIFDKKKVRIGEGWISISNLAPGEKTKFQTGIEASGTPVTLQLVPRDLPAELQPDKPAKTVSLTINTVPQGAALKVDGTDSGVTPRMIRIGVGQHTLEFAKEGFTPGRFPLEIGSDDASGGSVSFEMGALAHDTIELRDGSVLVGDVESMSAVEIVLRIAGNLQHMDRNKVKRLILTERDPPSK
jgi:PEGA domain